MYPNAFHYTKEHEWVRVEGDEAVIGITEFAQKQLGDIIYVELPEVGKALAIHQAIGVVESVKSVSDVYAPVGGEVIQVNVSLETQPELVNQDAFGEGWIARIRMQKPEELPGLMDAVAYEAMIREEKH